MRAEIEQAVDLMRVGSPETMEQVLSLLQDSVFSFSMKVCGHREDAEDTMQDVLLKSVRYLPQFTSPKALVVWLYKVAKNQCIMSRRRSKFAPRQTLSLEELMPQAEELDVLEAAHGQQRTTPEEAVLQGEAAEQLHQAVLRIPPQYRLILVLHDMEELSTEEIAKITNLREGTVRVRLHRARLFLRKELLKPSLEAKGPVTKDVRAQHAHERPALCKQMFTSLSDYVDGTLEDSLCVELEKHMAGCKRCEVFLESLIATVAQARKYRAGKPDPAIAAKAVARVMSAANNVRTAAPSAKEA
jgi:RNA polymerase sigma-70 factor (ECF subfamily)